ncbi:MAG: sporulation protein YtfJ [Clostridia bacterium]|nr:sporulation protein YtfJ [Clostridia bacterium]
MQFYSGSDTISELIQNSMDKIKSIVDSSTVIGEKLETSDGTIIIPISKVTVGYVVGGGEYADLSSRRVANHFPLAGGSSGGMSVTPVGFLVETKGEVSFINVENKSLYQSILNVFNNFVSKMGKQEEKGNDETKD